MTADSRRIATATGAMLSDPACIGNLEECLESLFDPQYWRVRGELTAVTAGRGAAWFVGAGAGAGAGAGVDAGAGPWVLRHFRRGGWVARFLEDRYVWAGEDRVRAFAEWRLLALLARRGLRVPRPVGARYQRAGLWYRCDLITMRIADTKALSKVFELGSIGEPTWKAVGAAVAKLHRAGVEHADLNAHNILLDGAGAVSVVDFDRGRLRAPGLWTVRNLKRLRRSLLKISRGFSSGGFSDENWGWVMAGYRAESGRPE